MKRKGLILTGIFFGLSLLLCLELGLILYIYGEPREIYLGGNDIEFLLRLNEEMRLGHIVIAEGGELSFFIDGRLMQFHVLSTQERLGVALSNAIKGDYGEATVSQVSVSSLLWPNVGWGALHAFVISVFPYIAMWLRKRIKMTSTRRWISLSVSLGVLMLSHLLFLIPNYSSFFSVFLLGVSALFLLLAYMEEAGIRKNLYKYFFLLSLSMVSLFLFGLYQSGLDQGLYALFFAALKAGDNHTYSVTFFFMLLLPLVFLFAGFLFRSLFKVKDEDKAIALA